MYAKKEYHPASETVIAGEEAKEVLETKQRAIEADLEQKRLDKYYEEKAAEMWARQAEINAQREAEEEAARQAEEEKQAQEAALAKKSQSNNNAVTEYNDDNLYLLSHLIMGEAGGGSDEMQLYVGSVVLNRVASSNYPNSIRSVIYQSGQYACTWDGNFDKTPTQSVIANAQRLLENGSVLPSNVVFQSQFPQGSGVYAIVQGEYFCY